MPMFKAGTIVLVNFPFTDLQSSKVRPALVITKKGDDVIILGIFSKSMDEKGDVIRKTWFEFLDNPQGLDMAIKDIKDNYELYVERFKTWLRK